MSSDVIALMGLAKRARVETGTESFVQSEGVRASVLRIKLVVGWVAAQTAVSHRQTTTNRRMLVGLITCEVTRSLGG